MADSITTADVTFWFIMIGGLGGAWWRIEAAIRTAKIEATEKATAAFTAASLVSSQLAEYKTHVAEHYITKAGMKETTDQILGAVHGVKTDVHGLNERIDRILENRPRSGRS
jgi:hypothetical protein